MIQFFALRVLAARDMSVKPSFSDGWTILGAFAAAVALAFLFVAPTLRARPA